MGGEPVIAAGMGVTEKNKIFADERSTVRLRQVNLMTLSSEYCATEKMKMYAGRGVTSPISIRNSQYGIICVKPNYARVQCTAPADSGRPLLLYSILLIDS